MDIADLADRAVEHNLNLALADLAAAHKPHAHTGQCLNCDEPVDQGLFCDAACRDDHAVRENARIRAGAH
jgi:hypothetical protein